MTAAPLDRCVDCDCNPLTGCNAHHEHDEPGWESDCHLCHLEGYGDPRDCEDCREAAMEAFRWTP